ncbi:MAG: LysR family transcriptional regulator [Ruthenibacterium sp.]
MEYFLAIAQNENITRAAQRLPVTRSALSRRVYAAGEGDV